MTQVGGPAALSGFLFQILHHADWLAKLSLQGTVNGEKVDAAQLILEPSNGGDAQAHADGKFLVVQYKSRGTVRPWSLAQVEEVLVDLVKAVPTDRSVSSEFRIVTNGRPGDLKEFHRFCARTRSARNRNALNSTLRRHFRRTLKTTDQDYFDVLVGKVCKPGPGRHALSDAQSRLLYVLSHFEIEFGADDKKTENNLDTLLRRYVPILGTESDVRKLIIADLFYSLSDGTTKLGVGEINEILGRRGISIDIVRKIDALVKTMKDSTQRFLARGWRYTGQTDVRGPVEHPTGDAPLIIYGGSGSGKTWQLGRTLMHLADQGHVVTMVQASQSAAACLTAAARNVWQIALGEPSDLTLQAVCARLRAHGGSVRGLPIVVAVDDIKSIDVARELLGHDWQAMGARLLLTTTARIAEAARITQPSVYLHRVGRFSISELRARLRPSNQDLVDIPHALLELLRLPILCGIYLDEEISPLREASLPSSEYEVVERYWARIGVTSQPGDVGIILGLAKRAFEGGTYPVASTQWSEIALTPDAATRLESTGWLQVDGSGSAGFFHERLLNWATAEMLVRRFRASELSIDDLKIRLTQLASPDSAHVRLAQFSFVTMDVVWLLSGPDDTRLISFKLVDHALKIGALGSSSDSYAKVLPSLGARALPILEHRIRSAYSSAESASVPSLALGQALASLYHISSQNVSEIVGQLLTSGNQAQESIGLVALRLMPDPPYIDQAWRIHCSRYELLAARSVDGRHFTHYQESFDALRACVRVDPAWLRAKIVSATREDPASELAYLLASLEVKDAISIWSEHASLFFLKVPPDKPRSLITCIFKCRDQSRIQFLIEHLTKSVDSADTVALNALALLDPSTAIGTAEVVDRGTAYMTRGGWLATLLQTHQQEVCERILLMAEQSSEGRQIVESLFAERPNMMTVELFRFYLDAVEEELQQRAAEPPQTRQDGWVERAVKLLGGVLREDLQAELEQKAGKPLEHLLLKLAIQKLQGANAMRDRALEGLGVILARMTGTGIRAMVDAALRSKDSWGRMHGIRWASIAPDTNTISLLAGVTLRAADRIESDSDNPVLEFISGLMAIAGIGDDAVLIDVLWQSKNTKHIPRSLPEQRIFARPVSDEFLAKAHSVLADPESIEVDVQVSLVIALISGNRGLLVSLRSAAQRYKPDSYTARLALLAMDALSDESDDWFRLARAMSTSETNRTWGLRSLMRVAARHETVLQLLGSGTSEDDDDDDIAEMLAATSQNEDIRRRAALTASRLCLARSVYEEGPYELAIESASQELQERVVERAFSYRPVLATQRLSSIEALDKFESSYACQAIEVALASEQIDEFRLCRLMTRIIPETAVDRLISLAVRFDRKSLPNSVGRAIRTLDRGHSAAIVVRHLRSRPTARAAVIEIAAWIPAPSVYAEVAAIWADELLLRDIAMKTMESHRDELLIHQLIDELRCGPPRWATVIAIAENADPRLLGDPEDSMYIYPQLREVPAMTEFVRRNIEYRLQDRRFR